VSVKYLVKRPESYKNSKGEEKTAWTTLGRVIENKKGLSLKMDVIPVGWDGWAYLFEPESKDDVPF